MDRGKLSAVGEIKNEEKGKNIAHRGGTPPFGNRVVAYMKKELHRHHEDAGTALSFCMECENKNCRFLTSYILIWSRYRGKKDDSF